MEGVSSLGNIVALEALEGGRFALPDAAATAPAAGCRAGAPPAHGQAKRSAYNFLVERNQSTNFGSPSRSGVVGL